MDPLESTEKKSTATKTIRLTRTEAYALKLAKPRQRRATFAAGGLLVAAILGTGLWHFQDWWLPFWLPETPEAPATATPAPTPTTPVAAPVPTEPVARPAEPLEPELDYLSAAIWDEPRFLQGVRLFNQAIDRHRNYLLNRDRTEWLAQIEDGALQAGHHFEALRAEAPASVPLGDYLARTRRLVAEARRLGRMAAPAAPAAVAKAPPPAKPAAPETDAEGLRQHPDYAKGARLFNQALEQFNQYKANTARTDLLPSTEELARQAGQTFEALKRQMPAPLHPEIDRHIHQSYGIVSACRGAQLAAGSEPAAPTFDRGTTGPSRRPALPAYQPVQ
jgi:hypothetical protein